MKTKNIIEGLQTLMPFYKNPDGYNCGAEHEELYAYPTDTPLDEEAIDKMIALGWYQMYENYGEFTSDAYCPNEGWVCYI